jgi:PAS domain S-box-containing protein
VDVTEYPEARSDALIQNPIPAGAVPLKSILYTEELRRRPSRPPDYEEENRALVKLVSALADSPSTIFQILAETILHITRCDSAGLSLLTTDGLTPDIRGERFYWPAIAGLWNPHVGGGTPRNFGPCGDVLDHNRTLLFRHFERRYPYLLPVSPAAEECLLVPFYVGDKAVGTIWAIMHSTLRGFDAEDERVMGSLGKFASSAYQAQASIDELRFQIGEREKAEAALHKLADGLETQVRVRTRDLERSADELLDTNKKLEKEIAKRRRVEERFRRSEARARGLANEQAALRRVATLVAQGAGPEELFSAVADEVAGIIDIPVVGVQRYEADGTFTMLGIAGDTNFTVGSRWPIEDDGIAGMILATGRPARKDDYTSLPGPLGNAVRGDVIVSTAGVPIVVEGSLWGFMVAAAKPGRPIPTDTEERLVRFTELVATAVSNATTRSQLIASRARIVAAGDEARRRIERNLHDGTQQRLVALGLDVETVRQIIPADQQDAQSGLERIRHALEAVLEDVREFSRGLHPALLSQAGLGPALRALARKSPIPVKLDVNVSKRPSESTETAVYYVVSEALANVVKHAHASEILVALTTSDSGVRATIEDDGVGGAEASAGSGLVGLIDRVEALGGRFALDSPPGHGTRISIDMPLTAEPIDGVARVPPGRRSALGEGPPPPTELAQPMDEALHAAVIAASADALYIVDAQGRIRFLNPAAVRTLGYEDERQLLGRPSHDTIHYLRPDGTPFPAAECPLLRPRLIGETVRVEEDWFVRQDGSLVAVAYSSAPVPLQDGRGAVVSFREISEHRIPKEEAAAQSVAQFD